MGSTVGPTAMTGGDTDSGGANVVSVSVSTVPDGKSCGSGGAKLQSGSIGGSGRVDGIMGRMGSVGGSIGTWARSKGVAGGSGRNDASRGGKGDAPLNGVTCAPRSRARNSGARSVIAVVSFFGRAERGAFGCLASRKLSS